MSRERSPHRKWRFSRVWLKDLGALSLDALVRLTRALPASFMNGVLEALLRTASVAYYVPGSPLRRAARDLSFLVRGVSQGRPLFRGTMERVGLAGRLVLEVDRGAVEGALERFTMDPASADRLRAAHERFGSGIIVVPHVVGSLLALARVARTVPLTLLYPAARNPKREALQARIVDAIGLARVPLDEVGETTAARAIIRARRDRRFIVGAADLNKRRWGGASIPATVFGEQAHLPAWPARFATRLGIPIVPVTAALGADGRFVCHAADPIEARDPEAATQAWASAFEGFFRRWPEDWAFLYDKRWSALVRRAAAAARRAAETAVTAGEATVSG